MVCAFNRPSPPALGEALAERFIDVAVRARTTTTRRSRRCSAKRRSGSCATASGAASPAASATSSASSAACSCRIATGTSTTAKAWRSRAAILTRRCWGDLVFAWRVCKHVGSNAIVLAKDLATIGIGGGQTSRVDSVELALEKAQEHGHDVRGAVLASDAFFPFPDGPQAALEAGVTGIIQPGGSKRDDEVTEAVRDAGAAMVLTGRRHFRH